MVDIMKEGDRVVIHTQADEYVIVILRNNKEKTFKISGNKLELSSLIGQPFCSCFQYQKETKKLIRLQKVLKNEEMADTLSDDKSNRDLLDNSSNQKLTKEEIEAMKTSQEAGKEIVSALIKNSVTFENKTEFSQEKYKKKKEKKYCSFFTALPPTPATLCDAYFSINPKLINFLRSDILSMMMSISNVSANKRVLVVESCIGMLTGALAYRMGSFGEICYAHVGSRPSPPTKKMFALKDLTCGRDSNIYWARLTDLVRERKNFENGNGSEKAEVEESIRKPESGSMPKATYSKVREWASCGFDSCLIAEANLYPLSILDAIISLLVPSSNFVLYSRYLEPLTEAYTNLFMRKDIVMLEVQHPWWREYQVLPERTHPNMDAKCPGGYLLSGIKVIYEAPPPAETQETLIDGKKQRIKEDRNNEEIILEDEIETSDEEKDLCSTATVIEIKEEENPHKKSKTKETED